MFCKKSTIQNTLSQISSITYRRCGDNLLIDNQQILPNEIINVWYITNTLITASEGQNITNTIDFPSTTPSITKFYVYSNTENLFSGSLAACNSLRDGGSSLLLIGYITKPLSTLGAGDQVFNVSTNEPIVVGTVNSYRPLTSTQDNSSTGFILYYQNTGSTITSVTSCNNIIATPSNTPTSTVTPTHTPTPTVTRTSNNPTPTPSSTVTPTQTIGLTPSVTSSPTLTPTNTPTTVFNIFEYINCCPPGNSVIVAISNSIEIPQDSGIQFEDDCYYFWNNTIGTPDAYIVDPAFIIENICNQPACACLAVTPSNTPSATVTPTITKTPTRTPTVTPTSTLTPTNTLTPTSSSTQTPTPTNTLTPTQTLNTTPTPTQTDPIVPTSFVSTWETTTSNEQIQLPLCYFGNYNLFVSWGDGQYNTITSYSSNSHTYVSPGTYTVSITGTIEGWSFSGNSASKNNFKTISQWGQLKINYGSLQSTGAFYNCTGLTLNTLTDTLNTQGVTSMDSWFENCNSITSFPYLSGWTMSAVTNTTEMFRNCTLFNAPMTNWDMSSCTIMSGMFFGCSSFNQNLSSWIMTNIGDVSLTNTFRACSSFNSPIFSGFSVGSFTSTFAGCTLFNQPLISWNTASVASFATTFSGSSNFNQSIAYWNTAAASQMGGMFLNASSFDQDISSWCVAIITVQPTNFDTGTPISWTTAEKPQWGVPC